MRPSSQARAVAVLLLCSAGTALAAPAPRQASPAPEPAPAPPPPPAAAVTRYVQPEKPESDSQRAMGTWALVVFNTKPFEFPASGGADPIPLTVYTVGLRHWTKEGWWKAKNWGVDAGVGLVYRKSSVTSPQAGQLQTNDGPSLSGFGLHFGLPLAFTHHQHATFELVPEADLIYAHETIPSLDSGGDDTKYTGWSARLGARAGFEIYFGFIGIPQLAMEASMGAAISYDSVKTEVGPIERSSRQWGITTQRGTEPWSIFTGSVAAMYHF
ncbi:MAG: hypothetical protein QM767_29555 [Anaeromyxobacter sp.]